MQTFDIHAQERTVSGKSSLKNLKNFGLIPGVLYHSGTSTPISIVEDEIKSVLKRRGEDAVLNVNFKGETISARIQEVQRDPVNQEIIYHIDIMPLNNDRGANYLH